MRERQIRVIKLFRVLSNPTRYKIFKGLAKGDLSVKKILKLIRKNRTITSQHLRLLRLANLVKYKYVNKKKTYMIKSRKILKLIKELEVTYSRMKTQE